MDGLAPTDRGSQLTAAQVLARLNANATIALTAPVTMASTLGVTGATTLNNTLTVNSTAVALANASAGGTLFSVTNNDTTSATQIEFKLIGTTSSSGRPAVRLFYSPNTASSSTFLLQTGKVSGLLFEGNGATVINQRDAAPIVIGINDSEVGRWTSSALQSQQSIDVYGNGNARRIGFNFFGSDQWGLYTDGATDAAKMHFRLGATNMANFDASGRFTLLKEAMFGQNASPQGVAANIGSIRTLTSGLGSSIDTLFIQPAYTGAFTVARAGYIFLASPAVGGSAVVTDACAFYLDAAAGTHKALDGATTKTTPGTVNAWLKMDVNGTIYYLPAYTSKTT